MRRQMVTIERSGKDKTQPQHHQSKNPPPSMRPKSLDQGNRTQRRDPHRQRAMRLLFSWNEVREDRGHGNQNRRYDAMHYAQSRCPDTKVIRREGRNTR